MDRQKLSNRYEKIVTHNDFDGIVSAALCASVLKIDKIIFTGPLTIAKSQVTITERDVVCDLPYPLECGLWFDHHEGNLQELQYRRIDPASVPGRFDLRPSCSRVVYEFFSEQEQLPAHFLKTVEAADLIDSFSYTSIQDWRKETPGAVIDLTLRNRFQSAEEEFSYLRNLVQQLRDRSLEEVASLTFVRKRLMQYKAEEGQMLQIIARSSYFLEEDSTKEMIVIDLTPFNRRPHLIRNLAFLIYPESRVVLEIYSLMERRVKSNHLGISMSLSISGNKDSRKNLAEIMRSLNIGDGHPGAAAGTVQCGSKQEMLKKKRELLNEIYRQWSLQ